MKSLKVKFIAGAIIIAAFFGVLLYLSLGNAFSPEKKIDGIENVGVSFEDFKIPTDVRVVGIGEGSHGNREFQVAKKEVLQKVVNEGNGHSISFEISVAEGAIINDAIHETETDLTELVGTLSYPLYDTEEIADLLTWMREYNQNVPYEDSIMFYGVDMQGSYISIEYIQGLCESGTSLFTEEESEKIMSVDPNAEDHTAERDFFEGLSERLLASDDIESKQLGVVVKAIVQGIDAPEYGDVENSYGTHRDMCMAENLKIFSEIEEARGYTQVIITAHNGHVMKGSQMLGGEPDKSPTMGENINKLFEGSYYCIGTEFYNGTVNIHTAGTYDDEYVRADHDFCSEDPLAYQAQYFQDKKYCLDFDSVTEENSKVYKVLHSRIFTSLVGEGYNLSNDLEKGERFRCDVTKRYDAMIYYFDATPIDPIHY